MNETVKKILKNLLKVAIVGALLYFLAKRGFLSLEETSRAFSHLDRLLPAYAVLFVTSLLCITRWQILLGAQGIHLGWMRTLQLTFIGTFFNLALPGAVSGDFVKAFYIAKEVQGQRAQAFGSILFDRVSGLSALVLISAGALIVQSLSEGGLGRLSALVVMVAVAAATVLVSFAYLFLVKEHHDPVLRIFRGLEKRMARLGSLTRIYLALRHYHNHRVVVLKSLLISMAVQLTSAFAFILLAQALGENNIPSLSVFVVAPLGFLATAIPLAPAGVGTGHVAFGGLFLLLGSQRGADIFSLFVLNQLIGGAIGGLIYLRFRSHEPKPVADPASASSTLA